MTREGGDVRGRKAVQVQKHGGLQVGGRAGVFVSASSRPGVDRDDPVESMVSAALSSMERVFSTPFTSFLRGRSSSAQAWPGLMRGGSCGKPSPRHLTLT